MVNFTPILVCKNDHFTIQLLQNTNPNFLTQKNMLLTPLMYFRRYKNL